MLVCFLALLDYCQLLSIDKDSYFCAHQCAWYENTKDPLAIFTQRVVDMIAPLMSTTAFSSSGIFIFRHFHLPAYINASIVTAFSLRQTYNRLAIFVLTII